jgi:hypothetical protein
MMNMNWTHNGSMHLCFSIHLNFSCVKLPKDTYMQSDFVGSEPKFLSSHFGFRLRVVTFTFQAAQIALGHVIVPLENMAREQISAECFSFRL